MELGAVDRTILEVHLGVALAFPSATGSIGTTQARQLADRRPDGEGLDLRDVADDLEVHDFAILTRMCGDRDIASRHNPGARPAVGDLR